MATQFDEILDEFPPLPEVELIEEDGEPLESDWHRRAMNLLIDAIGYHYRDRNDFYVGGNMFIYFNEEQARNRDFRGPDFYFVWGVNREPMRPYWVVWKEGGRYPDVIIELLSPKTAVEDLTTKKEIYEQVFRTPEYFCYDPATQELRGWRLVGGEYQPLEANEQGRLWCDQFELWLGPWTGKFQGHEAVWLRFFDNEGNVVPLAAEGERQRAEAAEAELAQLRARLAELESQQRTSKETNGG
jgi:Uma2 family endonuclease